MTLILLSLELTTFEVVEYSQNDFFGKLYSEETRVKFIRTLRLSAHKEVNMWDLKSKKSQNFDENEHHYNY